MGSEKQVPSPKEKLFMWIISFLAQLRTIAYNHWLCTEMDDEAKAKNTLIGGWLQYRS